MTIPKRFTTLALAALMLFAAVAPTAMAAEAPTLDRIVKDGILRVGMSGEQAPLNMRDENGKLVGMEVDLAGLLAAAFEVDLRMIQKPFAELLPALEKGEIDVIISGMSITPARTTEVTFVGPYVMSGKSLLTKSPLMARALDSSDLDEAGNTFAVLTKSTSESFVKKYMPQSKTVAVKNYDAGISLVRQGKVDGMIADMPACIIGVLRYGDEGLLTLPEPLSLEPIGIAIPANDPQLYNLLRNYLDAIQDMGLVQRLRSKWFDDGSWLADLP
jgi:polar amino acid transport system substrate-binding protein